MRKVLAVAWKELLQLRRDPKILPILFAAPVFQLLILGYAATTDVQQLELAVCDLSRTASSRELVRGFLASGYFRLVAWVDDARQLDQLLATGQARVAITIPADIEKDLAAGRDSAVQVVVDGSDPTSGTVGLAYAQGALDRWNQQALPVSDPLRSRVFFNPELRSRNFMVPAVLAMIIMVTTMMLGAMALVRERELGSWEQLLITPLLPRHIVLGKLLPYAAVAFLEIFLALPVALLYFQVPLRGSLALLLLLCGPFVLATLGLGLLVSTLSSTQQQAMMLAAFVFMLPQIYLSGFIFPIHNMPQVFQWMTYAVPLRYFMAILRGIFLKGVGLEVLWPQVLALLLLDCLILLLARARWRQTLA